MRPVAEEGPALHPGRHGGGREREHRGGQVDGHEQAIVHRAWREMSGGGEPLRPADDQGDVQPLLVTELLAADVGLAVVAEEDHERRVRQAVGLELAEDESDLAVKLGRRVEVHRPVGGVTGSSGS